jgi:hypothetical protein
MSSLIKELFLKSNLLVFIINNLYIEENTPKNICSVYKHMRFTSNLEIILEIQWNLSTPTYQGTRERYRIVQDVGILRFYFS